MTISLAIAAAISAASVAPHEVPPPVIIASPAQPTSQPVDPAAFEAAREMLRSINFDEQMDQTAQRMTESSFKTAMDAEEHDTGTALPEELKHIVYELLRRNNDELIAEMKPTALNDAARIYAKYFTVDEIRELQRIQSSPVMVKAQKLSPQLMTELVQIGMAPAAARLPELRRQVHAAVADWFAKHKKAVPHRS